MYCNTKTYTALGKHILATTLMFHDTEVEKKIDAELPYSPSLFIAIRKKHP